MKLKDKIALITGSTSGIGAGIAESFAKEGCHLVINGFGNREDIEKQRQYLESLSGATVMYEDADLAVPEDIDKMFGHIQTQFGGVDMVVNNAGIQFVSPIEDFPVQKWDQILAINLSASFHVIRHCIPYMKAQKFGRIINIASAHALTASPYKSAYVAAKHAIAGLTKTVALEVAEFGITVNAIAPAYVWTPLVEKQIPDTMKARNLTREQVIHEVMLKAQPTKKFVRIEEIANMALFLTGELACSITGSILSIDGGWTAQ
ncbi:MAG: 3-hydroxybutyrate dehydrogenase [Gammaproteobacteria bacterium]|nr:3-hydroxybutyrate dehydrogenase [Gammaproteobacteria bacterium]